ncbi:MAG: hypothetical protein K9M98_09220 [Cephaloticoccus sp.]|nr:hypothetical protein [Cephaloticoccus sp.]
MSPESLSITISINRLVRMLWLTVGVLLGMHVLLNLVHYRFTELPWLVRQIFDVDEEDSFPTWYSASTLLLTAFVLWLKTSSARGPADAWRWHWRGLAVGFVFLSIDEIAGIHETLNSLIDYSWAIPGGIIATLVGLAYLPFLARLERSTAIQFIIGGGIFVGGAVGVELYTEPFQANDELNTLAYNLWNALEEGMEMGGVLIFLRALLLSMKTDPLARTIELKLTD